MGSDVGQIFLTASLHRDHSISYALVFEKELSHMGKNSGNLDLVCEKRISEIYPGIENLILPMLSYLTMVSLEGCIHWFYWNSRTCSSSDGIIMLK